MADDTPAEIIKTKIIKIHKKSPTNTYPADDKKRKKPRETALAAASRVDDNLTVTVFPSWLHITSGAGVFQHRWSAGRTDRQWLRRRRKKRLWWRELSEVGLRCLTWLTQGRPVYEVLSWVPVDESVVYNNQSMVKKQNTFFYSSLPYCCSLLHLHVKPIAE